MKNFLIIILFFLSSGLLLAQNGVNNIKLKSSEVLILSDTVLIPNSDTSIKIPKQTDYRILTKAHFKSQRFYDSLQSIAYKNKMTRQLFRWLIRYRQPADILSNNKAVKSESYFTDYEGLKIRKINFIKVEVFGGSVMNVDQNVNNQYERLGNKIHSYTRNSVIRKNLLFEEGQNLDPYELSDSERIVRRLPFIRDVRIVPRDIDSLNDYVDVDVIVRDRFPWSMNAGWSSPQEYDVEVRNNNVSGFGNEIRAGYLHNKEADIPDGYRSNMNFRNVAGSFIDLNFLAADFYAIEQYGLLASKNFLSPIQKYNGELLLDRVRQNIYPLEADSTLYYERNRMDLWLSRSFQLSERSVLGLSSRYVNHLFFRRPEVKADSNEIYYNRQTYLASLFLSKTNFYKSRYIRSFNITEDIPIGMIYAIILGRNWAEFGDFYYAGIRVGGGTYTKYGYFFGQLESGSFISETLVKNSILSVGGNYFTPLFRLGNTNIRNFLRINSFISEDLSYPIARSLAESRRIRDISGEPLLGNNLLNGSVESVIFLNKYFYGFQFAPFLYSDFGLVEEDRITEPYSRFYNNYGLGLRVKNENLVFETFEIRFAWFQNKPENMDEFIFEFGFTRGILNGQLNVAKPRILAYD